MTLNEHNEVGTQSSALNPQSFSLFDRVVILVIAALIALIGGIILLGDRVGVQVRSASPIGDAHSTSPISIRFSEAMNRESVEANFHTDPAIDGRFSWSGATLNFYPVAALPPGSTYTVALEPGAVSETGRALLDAYTYHFEVLPPRVAYLFPADDVPHNVWIADPADPDNPQQVTHSPDGVEDFSVSPDGTQIAFAENNRIMGGVDLKLIDLETGGLQQLTNCQQAICTAPAWRPDGRMIAYERIEFDEQFGSSPSRIWLLDLTTTPATTRPLFQETQILGYDAQWSADGNRIALVDRATVSIIVYDFTTQKIISIASQAGSSGALSPDGTRLLYPDIVFTEGSGVFTKQRLALLNENEAITITDNEAPISDQRAQWSPDSELIALAREDQTADVAGIQIALLDLRTGETRLLTDDPRYVNLQFWWDPTGTALVMQRFPQYDESLQFNPNGLPEIWTYDLTTDTMQMIAINGYLPRWVP